MKFLLNHYRMQNADYFLYEYTALAHSILWFTSWAVFLSYKLIILQGVLENFWLNYDAFFNSEVSTPPFILLRISVLVHRQKRFSRICTIFLISCLHNALWSFCQLKKQIRQKSQLFMTFLALMFHLFLGSMFSSSVLQLNFIVLQEALSVSCLISP